MLHLTLTNNQSSCYCFLHTVEKTDIQRGEVNCRGSHSQQTSKPGWYQVFSLQPCRLHAPAGSSKLPPWFPKCPSPSRPPRALPLPGESSLKGQCHLMCWGSECPSLLPIRHENTCLLSDNWFHSHPFIVINLDMTQNALQLLKALSARRPGELGDITSCSHTSLHFYASYSSFMELI